jgi:hypothetical protein
MIFMLNNLSSRKSLKYSKFIESIFAYYL